MLSFIAFSFSIHIPFFLSMRQLGKIALVYLFFSYLSFTLSFPLSVKMPARQDKGEEKIYPPEYISPLRQSWHAHKPVQRQTARKMDFVMSKLVFALRNICYWMLNMLLAS
jgi:hypothetical protein